MAPPRAGRDLPRRKAACERTEIRIDPAHVRDYARATGGDAVPAFFEAQPASPPFYCATWETALALEMLAALETPLPLGAMVHYPPTWSGLDRCRLARPSAAAWSWTGWRSRRAG